MADPTGRKWHDMIVGGQGADAAVQIIVAFSQGKFPEGSDLFAGEHPTTAWQEKIKAAEQADVLAGSPPLLATNGHQILGAITCTGTLSFGTAAEKASRMVPFTALKPFGSDNPRDLWKWMANYEDKTGGRLLAIPHNGNLSNGRMFPLVEPGTGRPIDREYAETVRNGNVFTKRHKSKETAKPTLFFRPMTSLPISSAGTRAISI